MTSMLAALRTRLDDTRIIAVFALVYLASQAAIGAILHDLGALDFLKAQTTFSKSTYLGLARHWEAAGLLSQYGRHFYLDFFHPVWYALLLGALIARGLNRNGVAARHNWLLLAPVVAGLMDLVENCFHVAFISNLDGVESWMIVSSALAANIKWTLAALSVAVAVALLMRPLLRREGRADDEASQLPRG